jgi:CheY-like chemotaxis protein
MSAKKILMVDDDRDFVSAIATILSSKGYDVKIAGSGIEGYEMAQNFLPDLFILDVNMETKSAGFELNKSLRINASFKTTPIIMLTGIETISASNQILEMYNEMSGLEGFDTNKVVKIQNPDGTVAIDYHNDSGQTYYLLLDSFISKPVDTDALLKEIHKFLKD